MERVRDELMLVAKTSIFNIWNSIALIYTPCVEPVSSNLLAELHLFQFRNIAHILSKHWYTGEKESLLSCDGGRTLV